MTVEELARDLKLSVPMVYKLVARGEIGHLRHGRVIRFEPEHVAEYKRTHEVPAR